MKVLDMTATIAPKSDQINADDLIGGPRTITITKVTGNEGNAEQPVNVFFDGHDNPFRPCKSMRRVMVSIWGADASQYVGKAMTIYRDPKVKWGGMEVGGIRISHMSGLTAPKQMALTETRAKRTPYTVQPLKDAPAPKQDTGDPAAAWVAKFTTTIARAPDSEKLEAYIAKCAGNLASIEDRDDLRTTCEAAMAEARAKFTTETDDPFGEEA
jgi:hypothetical protein